MNKCKNCGKNTNNKIYCNHKCQSDYQYKQFIIRWKDDKENGKRGKFLISRHIVRYLKEKYNNSCAKCGWNKINPFTGNIPLECDHIDGNYENNKEENLILLCPNCHSLTSTYKGANKGHGRKGRE